MMRRNRDRQHSSTARAWQVAAFVAVTVILSGLASAQERGRCVTVDVPADFVTPVTLQAPAVKADVSAIAQPLQRAVG